MKYQFSVKELLRILDGTYYGDQLINNVIKDFEFSPIEIKTKQAANHLCFISISNKRWNQTHGRETNWRNGNDLALAYAEKLQLIITEEPIKALKNIVPQIIVNNSYKVIETIAVTAREKMQHPVIAITGSVGKSSTRLMIEHLVKNKFTYVATRGNHNTQSGVPLYGTKLCTNPQLGILEVSLNALNNRGNQSLIIQPDVVIVTSIGEAHLSTLNNTKNVALFKSRIFAGLKENGLVVINKDIPNDELEILLKEAKKRTKRIKFYSENDSSADMYIKRIKGEKYQSMMTIDYLGKEYTFDMKLPSKGIVMNTMAALLTMAELDIDLTSVLSRTTSFQSLDKVMQLKPFLTADKRKIELLDDSHNAALPSMINAIRTFKEKATFYQGSKILILGQIADLGKSSKQLHEKLIPEILSSGADYIFGHGYYMRDVIRKLPTEMVGGWFNNARDLAQFVPMYCKDESLILLKGSVSGSDFKTLSLLLPNQFKLSKQVLADNSVTSIMNQLQPMNGSVYIDLTTNEIIHSSGYRSSKSVEGLGAIIFLSLLLEKNMRLDKLTKLKGWPTNKGVTKRGKPYKTGAYFSHKELLEELMYHQHPSAIFELANIYFESRANAMDNITNLVTEKAMRCSVALNLTGRYRTKEQQSFYLEDLVTIGKSLAKHQEHLLSLKKTENKKEVKGIIFGHIHYSIIAFCENKIFCATGLRDKEQVQQALSSITSSKEEYLMQ